jgi:hypothetical protein
MLAPQQYSTLVPVESVEEFVELHSLSSRLPSKKYRQWPVYFLQNNKKHIALSAHELYREKHSCPKETIDIFH